VAKDVTEFVGWEGLILLANALEEEGRALFSTAFLTGGRITEVLELTADNFIFTDDFIRVKRMPLKKRYSKTGEWVEWVDERPTNTLRRLYHWDIEKGAWFRKRYETVRREEFRAEFAFPRSEPLVPILIEWVEAKEDKLFQMSRFKAYRIMKEIGIYPHWLRAQRASCLIAFWGFTMEQMMEWMGWEELTTARHYGKMGWRKLADMFKGIRIPQKVRELERDLISF
jgi:integrase